LTILCFTLYRSFVFFSFSFRSVPHSYKPNPFFQKGRITAENVACFPSLGM